MLPVKAPNLRISVATLRSTKANSTSGLFACSQNFRQTDSRERNAEESTEVGSLIQVLATCSFQKMVFRRTCGSSCLRSRSRHSQHGCGLLPGAVAILSLFSTRNSPESQAQANGSASPDILHIHHLLANHDNHDNVLGYLATCSEKSTSSLLTYTQAPETRQNRC